MTSVFAAARREAIDRLDQRSVKVMVSAPPDKSRDQMSISDAGYARWKQVSFDWMIDLGF